MALIKCPECRKEISEDVESCPSCGFKIKEFNEQVMKEQKKDDRTTLLKKIVFGIIAVIVIVIAVNIVSANQKMKSFEKEVDEFLAQWDELIQESQKDKPDRILVDLYNKNLVGTMDNIAEMYVQFEDKTEVNEYLEEHTWKEQYERVMKYNKNSYNVREIEQEFIDFYTNMEVEVEVKEAEIKQIVGEWNGLAIFVDEKLTPIDKGHIVATINDDNTFEFTVNDLKLSGVWADIDSSQLDNGEVGYNFVSYEGEEVGQGILSTKNSFIDPNSTYTLSMSFDDGELWVQFEK